MTGKKIKVTTFVGTRPEIIRLACIIKKFDEFFDHRLIHTGQNSEPSLSNIFFEDLKLRQPDEYLGLEGKSLGQFIGALMVQGERELQEHRPDALVILGDTNSSLIALIAKRMHIPIYHLEAGNRSFDANVPEEINRKVIDHLADFNLAYSQHAQKNLITEGLHPRMTSVIGSPLVEVLDSIKGEVESSDILTRLSLTKHCYFLVSAHRQENIDSEPRLVKLLDSLEILVDTFSIPILVSTHPRTRNRLGQLERIYNPLIRFHEPFGLIDYIALQKAARVVLSDSGSVSEEAAILGFKAITIRDSMERPEALETGVILMSGLESENILEAINVLESGQALGSVPTDYLISDTSTRVLNLIVSTVRRHAFWTGQRPVN